MDDPVTRDMYHHVKFGISSEYMILEAQHRGISKPFIYEKVLKELPPFEWQYEQLCFYGNLSEKEKKLLRSYKSYGYDTMNKYLWRNPGNEAKYNINDIIKKAPPLPYDIFVYRYTHNWKNKETNEETNEVDIFLNKGNTYTRPGYLSTSYLSSYTFTHCANFIKFFVPKGFRCISIPGDLEYELLFPHNTEIEILNVKDYPVECKKGGKFVNEVHKLYEVRMISQTF